MGISPSQPSAESLSREEIQTQLELAAQQGDGEAVRSLAALGGDVDALNPRFHKSPFHLACARAVFRPNLDYLHSLIASTKNINHTDLQGHTPLYFAISSVTATPVSLAKSALEAIQLLIQSGADVHARDKYGRTPLYFAAHHGFATAVKLLIAAGAEVDAADSDGMTPLAAAASFDSPEAMTELIKAGANMNAPSKQKGTPLQIAANNHRARALLCLVEHGFSPDSLSATGTPILHLILESTDGRRADLARRLLELGAQPSLPDALGQTALHKILAEVTLVRLLCAAGADVNAMDRNGRTPLLHLVLNSLGRMETLEELLLNGADPRIAARDGVTPLDAAKHRDYYEKRLRQYVKKVKLL